RRMERSYDGQAAVYDDFRKRLLKGRQELWNLIQPPAGGTWLDMGGRTGANLEYFEGSAFRVQQELLNPEPRTLNPCLGGLEKIYVLDLSHSLLEIAKRRIATAGWANVETVEADATTFKPPCGQVDVVTFSYSLTMI